MCFAGKRATGPGDRPAQRYIENYEELNQKLQEDIFSLKADNKKQEAYTLKINGYPGDDTTNFFRGSNL